MGLTTHETYMARCIELASRGRPSVHTNPLVGACIVANGRIIGEGYHEHRGQAHAEIHALNSIRPEDEYLLADATFYVSLEPCNHHGQTPPCTDAILRSPIPKIVFGMSDMNDVAAGGGQRLRAEGREVISGVLEEQVREQNAHFIRHHQVKRPYVTLKWAASADGFIGQHGRPIKLTCALTDRWTHRLRAVHDGILVGAETVRSDNPSLTTRHARGHHPRPIIWTRDARGLSDDLGLMKRLDTLILESSEDQGVRALLHRISEVHIGWLMVEGGRQVLQQFIDERCFDEAYRIVTPHQLGEGIREPLLPLRPTSQTRLGDDLFEHYRVA